MRRKKSDKRLWYPRCKKTGKISYPTATVAMNVMRIFMRTGKPDPGLHVYDRECSSCNGWHLGSSMVSLERIIRQQG